MLDLSEWEAMMKYTSKLIPKELKATLKKTGRVFGEDLLKLLVVDEHDSKKVLRIDYSFGQNASMYDLSGDITKSLKEMKQKDKSGYEKLINRVASHTFGDNVGSYVSAYDLPSGEGKWKLSIVDLGYDGDWLTVSAYLVPEGFEITE